MTPDNSEKILNWFAGLTDEQRVLAETMREIIFKACPDFNEEMKWNMPNYSLNKLVCYLQKSKTHVTIGFQQGAHINDPNGWLQGAGKDMRHLKYSLTDEIEPEKVTYLINQAIKYD